MPALSHCIRLVVRKSHTLWPAPQVISPRFNREHPLNSTAKNTDLPDIVGSNFGGKSLLAQKNWGDSISTPVFTISRALLEGLFCLSRRCPITLIRVNGEGIGEPRIVCLLLTPVIFCTGFKQSSKADYSVDTLVILNSLRSKLGDIHLAQHLPEQCQRHQNDQHPKCPLEYRP